MYRAAFALVLILIGWPAATNAQGYYCPPGSRPVPGGGGTMCLCPDGSYADIDGCRGSGAQIPYDFYSACMRIPGADPEVCRGGGGDDTHTPTLPDYPPANVYRCPSGGSCWVGQTCCGNSCCGAHQQCSSVGCIAAGATVCASGPVCDVGYKCSRGGGCVPENADDCGQGLSCPAGTLCWTAPEDVADFKRGETKCPTPEKRAELESLIVAQSRARAMPAREPKEYTTLDMIRDTWNDPSSYQENFERLMAGVDDRVDKQLGTEQPPPDFQRLRDSPFGSGLPSPAQNEPLPIAEDPLANAPQAPHTFMDPNTTDVPKGFERVD